MLSEIKEVLVRSRATLVEDCIGMVTIFTLLVAGLFLSGAA